MFLDWLTGNLEFAVIGVNIVFIAGLICLYAVMTYFFGASVGQISFWIMGIPLWLEVVALIAAVMVFTLAILALMLAFCVAVLAIYAICWVLTWPWRYRYRRLFLEYIGFDPRVEGLKWGSQWERKVNRKLKVYAVALQNALDSFESVVQGDVSLELRDALSLARRNYKFALKAAHQCEFFTRLSHVHYLPKRRRERIQRLAATA